MIAGLKPYPVMKDSGVEWLGEVPVHWKVRRIKTLFCEKDQRSGSGQGLLLSLTRARGIIPQAEASNRMASASDFAKYKICRPRDLVMNRMQAWSGMFAVSPLDGLVSPDYSVFEVASATTNVEYFKHLFKTPILVDQFARSSKGIGSGFNRLYTDDFGIVPVTVPSLPEQAAIVRYLDYVDRRVRRLVRAKRKLIALLTEQKQAIIHRAVTRGLDPDVPLKDSGVEWLGKVPAHWEVRRAKAVCSAIIDCKNRTPDAVDNGAYTVVRTTCIRDSEFDEKGGYKTDERNYRIWTARGAPLSGDVFFTREAPAGQACLVPDRSDLCMGQRMMYLRPDPVTLDSKFLLLNIYGPLTKTYVELATNGSTVGHLRLGQVNSLPILWCPLDEQREIVATVEKATMGIDKTIADAKKTISLIGEYRTRLIADVVTGKLDVREAAASLPDIDPLTTNNEPEDTLDTDAEADTEELDAIPEED